MVMWTDKLPVQLKARVNALVKAQPSSEAILNDLYEHLNLGPPTKKKKAQPPPVEPEKPIAIDPNQPTQVQVLDEYSLKITSPVNASEVICELSGLSFISPTRKKFNLLFHLFIGPDGVPQPVLSVVNMATNIPEISIRGLLESVKLCILIPILGNTTVATKKDTGMLCFWLNEKITSNKDKNEPIICSLNLDIVRKQLAKDGKLHPNAAAQVEHIETTEDGIKPVNGLILEFLERQFSLCGIQLMNFMPSSIPTKNSFILNSDNGLSISRFANGVSDIVSVSAFRGSKEGALLFVNGPQTSYMVFGFKKPIMIVDFSSIRNVSYKDITKFTFTVMVTIQKEDSESVIEFSMIDQKFYLEIDEFIRTRNIDDNSFDIKHREKSSEEKAGDATGADDKPDLGLAAIAVSDDEEDDGSYTGGVEGESDSDSENAEDFESNAESGDEDIPSDEEGKSVRDNEEET